MAFLFNSVAPNGQAKGLIPRNFASHPVGYCAAAPAFDMPLMTDDEIEAAIKRKDADGSWLQDIRNRGNFGKPIPSRDQNGKGYCWAHSGVSSMLLARAEAGLPYADLSAYAVACIIKGFRDEGGWGSEGVEFLATRGCPTSQFWAQQSMSRSNDNPDTWANAALHKAIEWFDLDPESPDYLRQMATCLCQNIGGAADFNWWGHSVNGNRLRSWGRNGSNLSIDIWNSWGDSWSNNGMGTLTGSHARPDAFVACRTVTASAT